MTPAEALLDERSFATTLLAAFLAAFGTEGLGWHPAVIRSEVDGLAGGPVPAANYDRLMAGIRLATTDVFFNSVPDFIDTCNIFSGSPATPGQWDPADALECAWGISEAVLLERLLFGEGRPPGGVVSRDRGGDAGPFAVEIRRYVGHILDDEGIVDPPDVLKIGIRPKEVRPEDMGDPRLAAAIRDVQAAKSREIADRVRDGFRGLIDQLRALDPGLAATA